MDILDIFYNYVVKEAASGRVNCNFYYNILFETRIEETHEYIKSDVNYENILIPVLIIKNKQEFDELLIKYVERAKSFYDKTYYRLEDLLPEIKDEFKVCEEKVLLTLLWSDATFDDFQDPINFLRKRIAFLESKVVETSQSLDYSTTLEGNLNIYIQKDMMETPYKMVINLRNAADEVFEFPQVKFGIADDVIYIYAIQNYYKGKNNFSKKVNRILYKVGEGFNEKSDNQEIYGSGNLKDITPSFLVALNIAVAYFYSLGYTKISVPSILISRWNAKNIMFYHIKKLIGSDEISKEKSAEYEKTQHNITEKFLRTFLRLVHHYESINVASYPFDVDSSLHLSIDGELNSNNSLLQETADLVQLSNNKNKNL